MTVSVKVAQGQEIKGLRGKWMGFLPLIFIDVFVKLYVEFFLKTEHFHVYILTNMGYLYTLTDFSISKFLKNQFFCIFAIRKK